MKNFKNAFACIAVCVFLFYGCSEEDKIALNSADKAVLSFGTLLNNMVGDKAALKQLMEVPECSNNAPAYVEVVLTQDGAAVLGSLIAPLIVPVNPNPGDYDGNGVEEYFTEYSSELELAPGTYSLAHFIVFSADDEVLWIAPRAEGDFAAFTGRPLPFSFDLGAGVKKYIDVEVLCFDDRLINKYGYSLVDVEFNEVLKFCFFANYCDSNGRHFPAAISVAFWLGTDNTGTPLYTDVLNIVENEGEDPSAAPVCFALPNLSEYEDDEDYLYYEVTVMDWDGVYGNVEQDVISGTLSRNDIEANFVGENNLDYEHLQFGCGDTPTCPGDDDCDEVPNDEDLCPGYDDNIDTDQDGIADGCDPCPELSSNMPDADNDCISDEDDDCPTDPNNDCIPINYGELLEFCFFANVCDENGRHYPASISVDIWLGTDNTGTMLYSNVMNTMENEGEDPSAEPKCFALPDLPEFEDDEDYIYYEVTVQDWTNVYGDVENTVISGTLSRNDIMANFDGDVNIDYEHLMFGCDDEPAQGEAPQSN